MADEIKNDLRDHLPRSLFMAVDRRDLLEILSVQDAIADCAEDIADLVTMRPMDLPQELHPNFQAFLTKCVDVARSSCKLVDRLDDLSSSVFAGPGVEEMLSEISALQRTEYESDLVQRTLVRRGATMGANSTIVCGIEVGAFAFVAAGAVVTKDVAPYALMQGVPARRVGWMCRCGTRLEAGESTIVCAACGNLYRPEGETLDPVEESQGEKHREEQHHG